MDAECGKAEEGGATESSDATKVTKPKAAKVTQLTGDKVPKPTATQPPKPKPAPTQPSKAVSKKKQKLVKETPDEPSPAKRSKGGLVGKRRKPKSPLKLVDEPSDEGVPVEDPAHTDEEVDLQRALELSLKEQAERTHEPTRPVVLREPDSGKYQPLPERRPPMHAEPTGHADSPSLDAELPLIDSETESDEEVPVINVGDQDEGQAGPNPGEQDEGQAGPNPGIQDKGQAGSNPGDAAESQPQPSHGENLKLPTEDQVILEEHASSTGTLSSLQNLDKDLSFTDQFFVEKPHEEESRNTNAKTEVSQAVDEIVTDAVDWAMQAPLRARFRDLPTKSLELYYSNQRLSDEEEARKKKRKKRVAPITLFGSPPSLPPPPPPPPGASGALGSMALSSSKPAASIHQSMAWTTFDTRFESTSFTAAQELSPTDSLMQDDSIPDKQVHLSDDEDFGNDHLPKADSRQDWWKPLPEEERPTTPEPAWTIHSSNAYEVVKAFYPDVIHLQFQMEECHKMLTAQVDWTNPEADQVRIDVNRLLPRDGPPGHVTIQTQFFFNKYLEYLRYGSKGSNPALSISKMKAASYPDFGLLLLVPEQIHDSPSRRKDVRTHMRILSVVRIKAYSRYGYDYLSEIVLRIVDFQEHTIAKRDFKNPYPSNFEELNLLLLQGHLDHLPGLDKRMLSTAVKLWTRNLVIRQRVEDFQLDIKSYQTQLNLTKPGWDATGYEFKHDCTIIESPRAVAFPVDNNDCKIMRFNEIYKFSDGTLTCIIEALDYRVKEFKVKWLNPGMNTRFWTEKDMTRCKEFIAEIERRLKTRRIYRNHECFVGGRVRDIDYRLLQRTE
ncbi:retrovirus-related pol polyprotein from transposon TNT 1-94 [Tanacetum coccineum]